MSNNVRGWYRISCDLDPVLLSIRCDTYAGALDAWHMIRRTHPKAWAKLENRAGRVIREYLPPSSRS
jgi:hypothetical protein